MAGITHLKDFQEPALKALVDLTEQNAQATVADRFLPTVTTFKREFAYDIVKNNQFLAGYIGQGSEPPVVDRNAVANRMGSIANFGLQDIATYEEIEAINYARMDAERQAAIDAITVKNVNILDGTRRLMYLAKMEALMKGTLHYNGNNVKIDFDFGIPAENKEALSSSSDFNDPDFNIIDFLEKHVNAYVIDNGKIPDVMLMSREVVSKMVKNQSIVGESTRSVNAQRVSQSELSSILAEFGLPPIEVITDRSVVYKDNETKEIIRREFMPVNRIVMASSGVGEYRQGPTLEGNGQPILTLTVEDLKRPIRSVIESYGAGFPVMEKPYLIRHLDVFTPGN